MGKIGIFLPGQHGDIACSTAVLKYKDILWPGKEVVWFCSKLPDRPCMDILNHNDAISEIRHFPEGWQMPDRCKIENANIGTDAPTWAKWADFSVLKSVNNKLEQSRKCDFASTADLDEGYFPAPWMAPNRGNLNYPNIPKKIFGVPMDWAWHPYLGFSDEERVKAAEFVANLPFDRTVMLETFMGSCDMQWTHEMSEKTMQLCRNRFGNCNFIFASKSGGGNVNHSKFLGNGVATADDFTVRQTALLFNHCDLFIGVSSGISAVVSCWNNNPITRIQWTSSPIITSELIANGPIECVFFDNMPLEEARRQLESKIYNTLHNMQ